MMPMRAAFRFDASPAMGAGHAYRCLTLAEALTGLGWRCYGITNGGAAATVPALRGNPALTLGSEDSVAARPADLLVVDHYGLDALWETPQRRWAKAILVLDDLADRRHDCDVLVDQTFGRAVADYDALLPAH
ncbi:MAG TPA: UDP-2,4-diacetamido-2,4,6-trideoxy-beta-L-altropyranose hydrolase, partial [Kiloniellaceae bacterium]